MRGPVILWTVHPTARSHLLLGDAFALVVPEPATLALVALAIAALAPSRRRSMR